MRSLWSLCLSKRKEKSKRRQSSKDTSGSISLIMVLSQAVFIIVSREFFVLIVSLRCLYPFVCMRNAL